MKSWYCVICGEGGQSPSAKAAEQGLYRHRRSEHAGMINRAIRPDVRIALPCGENCSSWNGKTVCTLGNITDPGKPRKCYRKDT